MVSDYKTRLAVRQAEIAEAVRQHGTYAGAARALGVNESVVRRAMTRMRTDGSEAAFAGFQLPHADPLPPDDLNVREIIAMQRRRFEARLAHAEAKRWREFRIPVSGPYALMFFGDPHIDDNGCNWPLLEDHAALAASTPALYAINIGDTTNNWTGRLAKLWANQDTSARTAREMARHFLGEMGIPWFLWLHGNHDCLTHDHEIYTNRGWLSFDDLRDDDLVVGIDHATGQRRWQHINERIDAEAEGVVQAVTASFSVQCTLNHRFLGQRRSWRKTYGKYEFCTPLSMPSRFRVPVAAESGNPDYPISDAMLTLLGWVMTDGTYATNTQAVILYQSKDPNPICRAIADAGFEAQETIRDRQITEIQSVPLHSCKPQHEFYIPAKYGAIIRRWLPKKLEIPEWVADLSSRQFRVLLDAIIAGDGSWYGRGHDTAIIYGREPFLSGLQAACVMHGWRATLTQDNRGAWRLNVSSRQFVEIERGQTPWVPVDGKVRVWCLRVPTGNFLVRRDGKPHYTGNSWDGPVGAEWFAAIKPHFVHLEQTAMEEWQAKVTLVSPNGFKLRLWAAHNFKGKSMWNPLHGPLRGAQMRDWAHIYAAGHHHDTGLMHFENAERNFYAWLLRTRGYKWLDEYADVHGFPSYKGGASVLAVVDPDASKVSAVQCFLDPFEGVEFLTWKRNRA